MTNRGDNVTNSFRALAIFKTMRTNLAFVDSFMRMSFLEETNNQNSTDLGFLGLEQGEKQRKAHNHAVLTLAVALLHQAINNYCDMKRFKPGLEDQAIENFLDGLKDKKQFIEGMRIIRNRTFHIGTLSRKDNNSVGAFVKACEQGGGSVSIMQQLLDLLYKYTEKCFMGELKIFPDQQYEELERRKSEDPQFTERLERGELTLEDLFGVEEVA